MSEPLREMISAVADGEASEFECRRVLDSLKDGEVRGLLGRHYALRSVMRGEADRLCPPQLTSSILAAVAAEGAVQRDARRWRQPLGGMAVAASVCLAAVFGLQALSHKGSGGDATEQNMAVAGGAGTRLGELGPSAQRPVVVANTVMGIGFPSAVPVAAGDITGDLGTEANRLAQQRLQQYMLEHAQNASLNGNQGMLPLARVVDYERR